MDQTGRLRGWKGILVACILLSRPWLRTLPLNQPSSPSLAGRCSMFAGIESTILPTEYRGLRIPALDKVHKALESPSVRRLNEKRYIDFGGWREPWRIFTRSYSYFGSGLCSSGDTSNEQQRSNNRWRHEPVKEQFLGTMARLISMFGKYSRARAVGSCAKHDESIGGSFVFPMAVFNPRYVCLIKGMIFVNSLVDYR